MEIDTYEYWLLLLICPVFLVLIKSITGNIRWDVSMSCRSVTKAAGSKRRRTMLLHEWCKRMMLYNI